jgi:glucose-6-phosphate isomerase|tara:strand:- start:8899 stop:10503 length:1605 start_codon:yes stop_codon:yes gene_type:complete
MNKIFLSQIQKIKKDALRCTKASDKLKKKNSREIFNIDTENIFFDYSRNIIDSKTIKNLTKLVEIIDVKGNFKSLCSGEIVNISEKRQALHPAMRGTFYKLDRDTKEDIKKHKALLKKISNEINSGKRKSFKNKNFTDVVSIGTGGSYYGIKMIYESLKNYSAKNINLHFISNLDSTESNDILLNLNKDTTLFILVSKSFKTVETLENARKVKKWLRKNNTNKDIMKNFIAVTENYNSALKFGIKKDCIIKLWDWIGGRYSLWTGVSIGLIIAVGYSNFSKFLEGARIGDKHFTQKDYDKNIPVIMALLSFYYTRFFYAQTHLVLPYNYRLRFLKEHLQQLEMESNGKSVDKNGKNLKNISGNIIWGATGNCSQHSFYQLLHQGKTFIPSDFIISCKTDSGSQDNHDKLFSNYLSHIEILNNGFTKEEALKLYDHKFSTLDLDKKLVVKNLMLKGNKPTNAILLKDMSPETLGILLSFYEHKTYILGLLSNVNSFDQWAVEIGKIKANDIYKSIKNSKMKNKKQKDVLIKKYLS